MADKERKSDRPGYYVLTDLSHIQPPGAEENVFRRYLGILRRRIWVLAAVLIVAGTVGVFNAFRAPAVYRAQARLIVERDVPKVSGFEGVIRDSSMWDPEFFNTQVELLKSRVVLETALEDPALRSLFENTPQGGVEKDSFLEELRDTILALLGGTPPAPPAMWERLRGAFSVKRILDTHFVVIEALSGEPKTAAAIVNGVAKAFETYSRRERAVLNGEAFQFLVREREREEKALAEVEKAFQNFRAQARALAVSPEAENQPVVERLSQINSELTKVQLERIDIESNTRVIEDITSGRLGPEAAERLLALPMLRNDPVVGKVWDGYVEAQKSLRELSRVYGPDHPALKEAQTNEAVRREELLAALTRSVQTQKDRLAILRNKEQELLKQYEEQKALSLEASKEAMVASRLQSEMERHRKLYDALLEKMLELDVSSDFGKNMVSVVELADVPKAPMDPQRGRRVLFAVIVGLFLGVGIAFLIDNLDETIRTPEDLKDQLTVPLLGFVPSFLVPAEHEKNRSEYAGRLVLKEPISSAAEAFRTLRTSLYFSIPSGETKAIAVTSCGPREGKTTTISNLAIAIAQSGKRALLIDADFHRPRLSGMLGLNPKTGLSDILVGEAEWRASIQKIEHEGQTVDGLDIIAAGSPTPSPAELLGSDRMRAVLDEMKQSYDWVLIDTPPVLFVSDASIICALADGVILVVMAGINNRSLLRRTVEHLEQLKVRIVGAVLTRMTAAMLGSYASDYAYHGYSRYSRDYYSDYYGRKGRSRTGRAVSRKRQAAGDAEGSARERRDPAAGGEGGRASEEKRTGVE